MVHYLSLSDVMINEIMAPSQRKLEMCIKMTSTLAIKSAIELILITSQVKLEMCIKMTSTLVIKKCN